MAHVEPSRLRNLHQYWCAVNYLTIGQIYLQENPLLRVPLQPEHIKPRLLGHWGTSPGLSFIYVHLNRLIQDRDANMIYLTGPGHSGPATVATVYLEGAYSEIYPHVAPDAAGLRRLFRRPKGGPGRRSSMACQWRGCSGPTRCRWPTCGTTRSISRCWSSGCAATGRRNSSIGTAGSSRSWPP